MLKKKLDWILGIDISTGGVKAMLTGIESDGRLAPPGPLAECVAQAEHADDDCGGRNPVCWFATYRACLKKLSNRFPEEIAKVWAVGLSTIFPGLYVLPKTGDLDLSLVRLYNDLDSAEVIARHSDAFDELERENRNVIYPGTTVANALFLMESDLMPKSSDIACLALPNTAFIWQVYREANEELPEYVSDFSGMVIGGVLEPRRFDKCRASSKLFGAAKPPFPSARPSWHNILPAKSDSLVRLRGAMGLPALESLAIGAGDSACGALALGGVLASGGSRLINIRGTSDTPMIVVSRPYSPRGRRGADLFHYPSPITGDARTAEWLASASILRSGAAWQWMKTICGQDHQLLEEAAKSSLIRSASMDYDKPVFVPFLGGERAPTWNPDTRGIIFGLTTETTQGDLALATMEGVSFALRADLELMRDHYPRQMPSSGGVMLMAGKPARSALWNWITEQITGLRVESPKFSEASVLGAALIAWASVQPERERRRRLIRASLASRDLLLSKKTPDMREELAAVRDRYVSACERAYAEFRELYRRLSLRERGRARACEEQFAVKRPTRNWRPLRG